MSNINKIKVSGQTYNIEDENATKTVELTQAQYDALTVKDPNTFYVITDAQGADLSQYYTSAQTESAITQAVSGKQDTLISGTNIKTINNESILGSGNIDIQGGGGKAIEAGRGISITTGETADTVSFNLPISAGTGSGSLIIGDNDGGTGYASVASGKGAVVFPSRRFYGKNYATEESSFAHGSGCSAGTCSHAEGFKTKCMNGFNSHSEGQNTEARGGNSHSEGEGTFAGETFVINACHAEGFHTSAMTNYSHAEGYYTKTTNESEHSQGRYNVSNKANGTWGDSGNTLFSVGNGTANNTRHNAFEIRQNGDIYLSLNGQDVKLQDQLGGGGGTSYSAGTGIDITNDVISVTGKVDTSAITTSITSSSTDAQVPSAKAVNDKLGGLSIVKLTESEYAALVTKDSNTLYCVVPDPSN